MKKLLLGLGILPLAIIPIITIASCSSTTSKTPLEIEVTKFNKSFKAKNSTVTTQSVIDALSKATDQTEKLLILNTYIDVPKVSVGFNLEVKSVNINPEKESSVNVNLTIIDTVSSTNSEATLVITDLTMVEPTLENEALKFSSPVVTTNPAITSSEAISTINKASSPNDKLKALQAIANVPKINNKFSMTVKSAATAPIKMAINVNIQLTEIANEANTKEVVLTITNFKEVTGTLNSEVAKLNTSVSTTVEYLLASDAVNQINNAADEIAKYNALTGITNFPEIASSFTIKINQAKITDGIPTSITIPITISDPSLTTNNTGEATFVVTNLWQTSLQNQKNKFGTVATISPTTTLASAISFIGDSKKTAEEKLTFIKTIAKLPSISDGYTLEPISGFDSPSRKDLIITFRIHQHSSISNNTRFISTIFRVTGLKI